MIHIDLVDFNTKLRIIRTENAKGAIIELPHGLTTGGVGLPALATLVDSMNAALRGLGLQFPPDHPANVVIPEGEDA